MRKKCNVTNRIHPISALRACGLSTVPRPVCALDIDICLPSRLKITALDVPQITIILQQVARAMRLKICYSDRTSTTILQ